MNRKAFFDAVRGPLFNGSLSGSQVLGIEALLDACERHVVRDPRHVANILAQVYHETGRRMVPVRETYATSDQQAINRLETAWNAGKLKWVKTPYWRDGWFGRGHIQITHKSNYDKLGKRLGVNLVAKPALALDMRVSADIAVVGMKEGLFTGHKLSNHFTSAIDDPISARRIVNGTDQAKLIAGYHAKFLDAVKLAGKSPEKPAKAPPASNPTTDSSKGTKPVSEAPNGIVGLVAVALAIAAAIISKIAGAW